jgi:hypothetical protein
LIAPSQAQLGVNGIRIILAWGRVVGLTQINGWFDPVVVVECARRLALSHCG